MTTTSSGKNILIIVLVVLAVLVGYYLMTQPDNRNPVQKVGDAIQELPNTDKAAEQLENRTPAEKAGDAIEHKVDEVKQDIKD